MFDLEKSVREWKARLRTFASFEDGHVAELESHLRDEVDRLRERGWSEESAFAKAAAMVGELRPIAAEFDKTGRRHPGSPAAWPAARFSPALLLNYLKVALRKIRRQRGQAFINIASLCVGMTCCLLLLLWIRDELGYDRYHANADRIYRAEHAEVREGRDVRTASTPAPLAPALQAEIPGIERAVRIGENGFDVIYGSSRFQERVFFADPEIFDVFSFPLVAGDPRTALREPDSILISEDAGRKYFGEENPIGRVLTIRDWRDFRVTGVLKNIPRRSHFRFDFLAPFQTYARKSLGEWGISNYYTYLLVDANFRPQDFAARQAGFVRKYRGASVPAEANLRYVLQPLARIHLFSRARNEIEANGDFGRLVLFSAVAFFILIIACFNYINFSVASSVVRAREVGLRKVVGAAKRQIAGQFLGESFLVSALALAAACLLARLLLPAFNALAGKSLVASDLWAGPTLIGLAGFLALTGGLAGGYSALVLSSVLPAAALHGSDGMRLRPSAFRSLLVVVQFSVSVVFLVATLVIAGQMRYVREASLGFDGRNVINLPLEDETLLKAIEALKTELGRSPAVAGVTASSFRPGRAYFNQNYWKEGMGENEYPMIGWLAVDHDYLRTMGIELRAGRDFSRDIPSDAGRAYILNETAVREIGLASPLGRAFKIVEMGTVIGVAKDFHFDSLHRKIEPLALCVYPPEFQNLSVRARPGRTAEVLAVLAGLWRRFSPEAPFRYSFLDEDIGRLYETDRRLYRIFLAAAGASILVAGLGLFGLASLTARRRTKEIGIRKVLGASATRLTVQLSGQFLALVVLANIVAWPIAYYAMGRWLEGFAYRAGLSIWPFLLSALFAFAAALLAVGFQTAKSARADPVRSLRWE